MNVFIVINDLYKNFHVFSSITKVSVFTQIVHFYKNYPKKASESRSIPIVFRNYYRNKWHRIKTFFFLIVFQFLWKKLSKAWLKKQTFLLNVSKACGNKANHILKFNFKIKTALQQQLRPKGQGMKMNFGHLQRLVVEVFQHNRRLRYQLVGVFPDDLFELPHVPITFDISKKSRFTFR